jgi:4'-phosphopantetheinyl transferase
VTAQLESAAAIGPALAWTQVCAAELPLPPRPGEAQLWSMSLDNPPWPRDRLLAVLSSEELERASRFRFEVDRQRFALARGMLRHLLGHAGQCDPKAIRFRYGPQGKPSLEGPAAAVNPSSVDFNLSHSRSSLLIGLSDGAPIGVDLELPTDAIDFEAIAEHTFSCAERLALGALHDRRRDAFFACWTLKEALVKAWGGGLTELPPSSFDVSVGFDGPARILRVEGSPFPAAAYTVRAGLTPDGHACAAVVCRGGAQVRAFVVR